MFEKSYLREKLDNIRIMIAGQSNEYLLFDEPMVLHFITISEGGGVKSYTCVLSVSIPKGVIQGALINLTLLEIHHLSPRSVQMSLTN